MGVNVVIVESPAKAKTINKYLGSGYEVVASFGHVRDLPPKDGSVDPDADFAMLWESDGRGAKRIAEIAKLVKGATSSFSPPTPTARARPFPGTCWRPCATSAC